MSTSFPIRVFGDPVLRRRADDVAESDFDAVRRLVPPMLEAMHAAPGIGLAATQVGVQKRFFVYDMGEAGGGSGVIVNPIIVASDGVWTYDEGCLSVPGLVFPLQRPKTVHLRGYDLDGREIDIDGDEILARLIQHEVDHLDGVLVLDRVESDVRKEALKILRHRALGLPEPDQLVVRDRRSHAQEL